LISPKFSIFVTQLGAGRGSWRTTTRTTIGALFKMSETPQKFPQSIFSWEVSFVNSPTRPFDLVSQRSRSPSFFFFQINSSVSGFTLGVLGVGKALDLFAKEVVGLGFRGNDIAGYL